VVAAFVVVSGALCKSFGWQWGMMAPGAFGLAAGMVLLLALKDKPEDAGAGIWVRGLNGQALF
jgi:sugar phosphate permease